MAIQTFPLQLKSRKMISPAVLHLGFVRSDGESFIFTPGQFITIHFEHDGKTLRRSYSIATISNESDLIEIAVSHVKGGPGTELLYHLKEGDTINTTGPFGRLVMQEKDNPQRFIFIATGTGVTPYRAMLPELAKRLQANPELTVELLFGVRTYEDLIYGEDFIRFAEQQQRFHFHACLSRDETNSAEAFIQKGYVQAYLKQMSVDANKDLVYLCGNPNMIDECFEYLQSKDFDVHSIRREKYISPGGK